MQNGFFKTYGKVILFAFLGISIVAAVIGQNKQRNTLAVYTSTDVVQQETLSDSSSEEENIEMQIYADNTYHFSISIPKDWTQVIDHDTVSYIHKPSGATIRMEVFAYNPAINNVAADTLSASITQDGKTFKKYTAPPVGQNASKTSFDVEVYSAEVGTDGETGNFSKVTFPSCKGKSVPLSFKDGEYY